jgi:hypothetical protein
MDPRLKELGQKYGGTFGGNGVAQLPTVQNANLPQIYFDPTSNQHVTVNGNGAVVPINPVPTKAPNLFQKIASIGTETFGYRPDKPSLLQTAVTGLGKFVYHTGQDIFRSAAGVGQTFVDAQTQPIQLQINQKLQAQLNATQTALIHDYGVGKVSRSDYEVKLKQIADAQEKISRELVTPILAGPTPAVRARQVVDTAVNALSLGTYTPVKAVGAKAVGKGFTLLSEQPARQGIEQTLFTIGQKVEDALQRIPSFRDLVTHNTQAFLDRSITQLSGETSSQFIARNAKNIAVGLLIKRPILYQTNIGQAESLYNDLLSGHYGQSVRDAAWIGAQAIGGGPIGWFFRNTKRFGGTLRELANGKGSFIDELSKRIGDGSPVQIATYLQGLRETNPGAFTKAEKTLRIAQEVNLQATGEDVTQAALAVTSHYDQHAIDLTSLNPERLVGDLDKWAQADEIARKLDKEGKYVAVRWDTAAKNALADRLIQAGDDFKAMADAITEMSAQPGVGWGNNQILMARITNAVRNADSAEAAAKEIRGISTAATLAHDIPPSVAKRLEKLGYSVAEPWGGRKTPKVDFTDTRRLVSAVSNGSDIFDEAVAPHPALESIAAGLRKFGLSPEANTKVAYDKLSEALVSNLNEIHLSGELGLGGDVEDQAKGAKFILSRLQSYINRQKPNPYLNVFTAGRGHQSALQDIRQMNIKEIMEALPGVNKDTAKGVQRAVLKAYTDVPLEFRGLGIKAFDYAYRTPGARAYFRIQSALRYTYNPFFRLQEVAETKILSHAKANNLVWMKPAPNSTALLIFWTIQRSSPQVIRGEATQDLTIGRIHANLLNSQRRDLAGLALDIASKRGTTVEQMIQDHPDELADALRVIVQYPTKGVLNSPLARTLNIVFFPMRYNIKVTALVAKEVAKLPPTVQTAFIHSMFKMSDWLKSSEGIQWQSNNADAIQVFSYFTPMQNIQSVLNLLHGGVSSVGELGQLGGLPFGFIAQI